MAPSQKAREYFDHLDSKTREDDAIYLLPGHLDRFTLELREALRDLFGEMEDNGWEKDFDGETITALVVARTVLALYSPEEEKG